MKIIHILPWTSINNIGGTEKYILNMSNEQALNGHECILLSPSLIKKEYYLDKLRVVESNLIKNDGCYSQRIGIKPPENIKEFEKFIINEVPDIVYFHCFWPYQYFYLDFLSKQKIKTVVIPHLSNLLCLQGELKYKNTTNCDGKAELYKCFECVSSRVKNPFLTKLIFYFSINIDLKIINRSNLLIRIMSKKLEVKTFINNIKIFNISSVSIHALSPWYYDVLLKNINSENLTLTKKTVKKDINISAKNNTGKIKLLFVGRLVYSKGIDYLFNTFIKLNSQKYKLTIIGPPDSSYSLPNFDNSQFDIDILGPKNSDEVKFEMQKADYLIVPSRAIEMKPLVIIEAIAEGLPVIGVSFGGVRDLIEDSGGILFDINNDNSLLEVLKKL